MCVWVTRRPLSCLLHQPLHHINSLAHGGVVHLSHVAAQCASSVICQLLETTLVVCAAVTYDWAQSLEEVLIEVLVPACTTAGDILVTFGPHSLLVMVGQQCAIDGELSGQIETSNSSWRLGELPIFFTCMLSCAPEHAHTSVFCCC